MAYIPASNSVVAFQSDPTKLQVTASVAGTVNIGTIPGSVVAFQGTSPWIVAPNNSSMVTIAQGSVAVAIVSGSVAVSVTPPANQSVSGVTGSSIIGYPAVNVGGSVVGFQGTSPWVVNFQNSSILSVPVGSVIGGSIAASFTPPANQSVSGTVNVTQGTSPWIVAPNNSSLFALQPAGSILATSATVNMSNSSVMLLSGTNVIGSVTTLQGTNPWITTFSNSSILAVPVSSTITVSQSSVAVAIVSGSIAATFTPPANQSVSGTVNTTEQGTWQVSVVGNYATGAASVVSGMGVLGLGIRNDTLGSVLATDGQYSPFAVGNVGEVVIANSPLSTWIQGTGSCFTGVFQPIIGSVAARYTYVTGVQVINTSSVNAYIAFSGAGIGSTVGSLIAYTVAPANGGSNIVYPNGLKSGIGNPIQASINAIASVYLSMQGFTSKT